jgi:hypothetical protein
MTVRRTGCVSQRPGITWCSLTLEELLLELGLGDLDLDRLVHLLVVSSLVVGVVFDRRGEQRVDERRLAEARFAGDLEGLVRDPTK